MGLINVMLNQNNPFKQTETYFFMQEIQSNLYKEKICENLLNIDKKQKKDFFKIRTLFDKNYIMGGFVRDSILQVEYGYSFPFNDLDILVEDKDFDSKLKNNFNQKNKSRFGGLKLKYNNSETDVFGMNKIFYFIEHPEIEKNLENVLKGADLTTSAFAYDIERNKIYYGHNALEDVFNKEVNVGWDNGAISATISRLIIHADKMGFKIGEKGKEYLKQNYSESLDPGIKDYLEYKNVSHLFPVIKKKLNSKF